MTSASAHKILAWVVSAVVISAVVTAILLDPPGIQRQRKMDARRVEDLSSIKRAIEEYCNRHKVLPTDLATLAKEPGLRVAATDPDTGSPYVYEVTGPNSYRLCAVFARDSSERSAVPYYSVSWAHGPGRHCFDLTIPM